MNVIASRTPDGDAHHCPVCQAYVIVEPSAETGDAPCPECGQLLWWIRERIAAETGIDRDAIRLDSHLYEELGMDSLDTVELVMELEEEYDLVFPDDAAERVATLADAIRLLRQVRALQP